MIKNWQHHSEFQKHLVDRLSTLFSSHQSEIEGYSELIHKVWLLDLDKAMDILQPIYPKFGRPAKQQIQILRSLIAMLDQGFTSLNNWVDTTRKNPVIAVICGFHSEKHALATSNYYDFFHRFWSQEKPNTSSIRKFSRKPRKKLKQGEKLPPKHLGVVKKLADKAMQGRTFSIRPELFLQKLFANTIVNVSAQKSLLGPLDDFSISGDSTSVYSGGSSSGIKVCNCKKEGIYNCKCPRRFSDPSAAWGWDSHREIYYYGRSLYTLTASSGKYDLPIYIRFSQANRHDSVMSVVAISEAVQLYPNFSFTKFSGDSAQDAFPIYEMLNLFEIAPIIPLNKRKKKDPNNMLPVEINEKGAPVCAAGHSMINWGVNKKRSRRKWRCPFACGKVKECLLKDNCSNSAYGRVVYTRPEWDYRLFTPIIRGSQKWKDEYKKHSMSERVNKRMVKDYSVRTIKARGTNRSYWWATIAAFNIHLDAWVKETKINLVSLIKSSSLAA